MISSTMPENPVERIRHNLVGLRMPRALEALEGVIQQLERGQLGAIEAIDTLLAEEITVRDDVVPELTGRRRRCFNRRRILVPKYGEIRHQKPSEQARMCGCRLG